MSSVSRENALWLALLLLGGAGRLIYLGSAPLNDAEASVALESANISRGLLAATLDPLRGNVQAAIGFLFGASDSGARMPVALAGALLPVVPWFARSTIGRTRALVLGTLLAISPTIWYESRQADGSAIAWALALALQLLLGRAPATVLAVVSGLLLACGNSAMLPLLALGAAALGGRLGAEWRQIATPRMLALAIASFALGATLFGLNLSGLGNAFAGLAQGAVNLFAAQPFERALPATRALLGIGLYELLPILLLVFGGVLIVLRRPQDQFDTSWLGWTAVCMVAMLLPGRSTATITGLVIAAAFVGATAIETLVQRLAGDAQRVGGAQIASLAGLSWLIGIFACVSALQFASQGGGMALLSFAVGLLAIVGICMLFSANISGWVATRGALTGLLLLLAIYTIGKGYNLAINRSNDPGEPYVLRAASDDLGHLRQRLERIGTLALGDATALTLAVDESAPPSVRWAVRDFGETRYGGFSSSEGALLLPANGELKDASGYLGDAFVIGTSASLSQLNCKQIGDKNDCGEYSRWLALRQLETVDRTQWVLWVRNDIAAQFAGRR